MGINHMNENSIIYGNYLETKAEKETADAVSIDFIVPMELTKDWHTCGSVADYIAKNNIFNFNPQENVVYVITTAINELLENAYKFSSDINKLVTISVHDSKDKITIETINASDEKQTELLMRFMKNLNQNKLEDLFIKNIEYNAQFEKTSSRLGLITILKDYKGKLGIKISSEHSFMYSFNIFIKLTLDKSNIEDIF
ncbi:MAG: hypothetical protein GY730_01370 [bacterium]|nr:hypothetical protein [bacterium]